MWLVLWLLTAVASVPYVFLQGLTLHSLAIVFTLVSEPFLGLYVIMICLNGLSKI